MTSMTANRFRFRRAGAAQAWASEQGGAAGEQLAQALDLAMQASKSGLREVLNLDPPVAAVITLVAGAWQLDSTSEPTLVLRSGTQMWLVNGVTHRDADLPAVIWADGTRNWYCDGIYHRDGDLPAYEATDGHLAWYRRGHMHREVGPALIMEGRPSWFLQGENFRREMEPLVEQLRAGGVLIKRTGGRVHPNAPLSVRYQLETVAGEVAWWPRSQQRTCSSAGWLDWIEANAQEYFPELAAAMRARAMHAVIKAPSATAAPRVRRIPI